MSLEALLDNRVRLRRFSSLLNVIVQDFHPLHELSLDANVVRKAPHECERWPLTVDGVALDFESNQASRECKERFANARLLKNRVRGVKLP